MPVLLLALVGSVALAGSVTAQPAADLNGGTGTIYVGAYPGRVFVVDEATEQVVDDITMTLDGPPSSMARVRLR